MSNYRRFLIFLYLGLWLLSPHFISFHFFLVRWRVAIFSTMWYGWHEIDPGDDTKMKRCDVIIVSGILSTCSDLVFPMIARTELENCQSPLTFSHWYISEQLTKKVSTQMFWQNRVYEISSKANRQQRRRFVCGSDCALSGLSRAILKIRSQAGSTAAK